MNTTTDDLEAQIRSAFRYRADQLPTSSGLTGPSLVEVHELTEPRARQRPSPRGRALVAAVLVVAAVVAVGLLVTTGGKQQPRISGPTASTQLSAIPNGVSVQQFGQHLAFVVRNGEHVTVFDTNVHHLAGEQALWWCPREQQFVSPTHAETFSPSGRAIGGPATAGLDRMQAVVRRGKLVVAPTKVTPGQKGNTHTADGTGAAGTGSWDSGPGTFCSGALKAANGRPSSVLDVEALASIRYDKPVYEVPAGLTEIRFSGATGILLTFDDPRYRYCLIATDRGAPRSCRVYLTPGDYLVYDSVPGHREQGYEATIHVTDPLGLSAQLYGSAEERIGHDQAAPGSGHPRNTSASSPQPRVDSFVEGTPVPVQSQVP